MPISAPSFRPIISIGATTFTVQEDTTIAGSAQVVLPDNTRSITLRSRTPCVLKVSSSLGGPYITIKINCSLSIDNIEFSGKILYIESSIPITVVESLATHG